MISPPPTHLMFDGPADEFETNGKEFLGHYKDLCALGRHERMLDVGSGIGRKTIPLTEYLADDASYEGIDCNLIGVRWCQDNISPYYPNFQFQWADIRTPGYNPTGAIEPEDFRFPYGDAEFDFVMLGSVFTHMRYDGLRHYLKEIRRVMKPEGRCLITWFVMPGEDAHKEGFPFSHPHGCMASVEMPEQAIAYTERAMLDAYVDADLKIQRFFQGTWAGRSGLSYQDMVLARRFR